MTETEKKLNAVIKVGSKQFLVKQNDVINVDLIDAELGAQVQFEPLFVNDESNMNVGAPGVVDYFVTGELLGIVAGPKIQSVKYKPNHTSKRKFGHRQHYTRIRIVAIGNHKKAGKHGS